MITDPIPYSLAEKEVLKKVGTVPGYFNKLAQRIAARKVAPKPLGDM